MARPKAIKVGDDKCLQILALLKANPSLRMGEIAKAIGMYKQLTARRMNVLVNHDLIHSKGERQFTQWYLGPSPLEGRAKGVPDMFLGVGCIFQAGQNLAEAEEEAA